MCFVCCWFVAPIFGVVLQCLVYMAYCASEGVWCLVVGFVWFSFLWLSSVENFAFMVFMG